MTPAMESRGTPTVTLRKFLLGDADAGEMFSHKLGKGALRSLGKSVGARTRAELQVMRRGLGKAAGELLELDLIGVLVSAWVQSGKLAAAARTNLLSPAPQRVVLLAHTVTSRHNPYVDVLVDGIKKTSVRFEFYLEFEIQGVVATVRSGRLIAFDVGACTLKAVVSCQGMKLLQRSGELMPACTVTLPGGGHPLVPPAERRVETGAPPTEPLHH